MDNKPFSRDGKGLFVCTIFSGLLRRSDSSSYTVLTPANGLSTLCIWYRKQPGDRIDSAQLKQRERRSAMNDSIVIRDATIEDLPAIVDIYNSTVSGRMATADTEPVTVQSREQWFHEHSPHSRPLWVAEHEGKILGWLSFQSFYGRPAYHATAEVSIYIHPEHRKKGLGAYLLEKAIAECSRLKIKTLLGFIFGHNEPSLNLFEKFGFEKWGHLPSVAELDGTERDLVIVGKRVIP
jgi:phosphinothricin acetyltransferase